MSRFLYGVIVAVFGALYAWDLWEALGNLVGLGPFYEAVGIGSSTPWLLLWVGVFLPVGVFVVVVVISRLRPLIIERVVVFVVGWAIVAALSSSIAAIEQAWRAAAIQALPL